MWKWTHKDGNAPAPVPSAVPPVRSIPSEEPEQTVPTPQSVESFCPEVTLIGKSIAIRGKLSGSENVYMDGELEGSVELLGGNLTVGPDGHISADVQARSIVVHGRMNGNPYGTKRVDLKKSAVLVGDICTPRFAIEEGALLEGSVLGSEGHSCPPKKESRRNGRLELARRAG